MSAIQLDVCKLSDVSIALSKVTQQTKSSDDAKALMEKSM